MRAIDFFPGKLVFACLALFCLAGCGVEQPDFLVDPAELSNAIAALHAKIGTHPRVLKIEVEQHAVTIEAQEAQNPQHIDQWKYAKIEFGPFAQTLIAGPEPVELHLINPDVEANLFDLDAVDFSATAKLSKAAIAYAHIADPAHIDHMEISRQLFILPQPSSGDIRWRLIVRSAREHAEISADASGRIVGSNLSGTQRAQTLDLIKEPATIAEAATAFRSYIGAGAVITAIRIDKKLVAFDTNIPEPKSRSTFGDLPATSVFTWNLDGLHQPLGRMNIAAQLGRPAPPTFSIDDLDWTLLAKIEADAVAKVGLPGARVSEIKAAKSVDQPGAPLLLWTLEIADREGEVTKVLADAKGVIKRVVLPASRRPAVDWRQPAAFVSALARISQAFGGNARIATIYADERGGRVSLDDPQNAGKLATFDFGQDGLTRAAITFTLYAGTDRFSAQDLAAVTEQKLAALLEQARQKLAPKRQAYLESITIGSHPFARGAGPHAIEIRLRDVAVDSASANYAWIVFGFDGRVIDSSSF